MTKLKSDISVIIPCWNSEKTIKKAVKSALAQTLPTLEILVCDDGSTDKSKEVIKSIKSPLVKWVSTNTHSGQPAVPRNRGLNKAKGKWLAFLDADDEWLPNKLKTQVTIAKKTGYLAVCTNAYKNTPNSRQTLFFNFSTRHFNLANLLLTNYVICSSMLIHGSLLNKAAGFPENNNLTSVEDYALWLRIAAQTKILYLDTPLVIYNDKPKTSVRSKVNINPFLLKIYVLKNFYEYFTHR